MKLSNINKKNIVSSIKFCIVIPFALLLRKVESDIWIIAERPNQARDNGYCFFKYVRTKHPERKIFYIIDKNSKDYKKLKGYKNIIQFNSWKHYFYYCLSKVHISAHVNGCAPLNSPIIKRIYGILRTKNIFIPHGVSYGISEFCLKKYARINLFICSGKKEYENVIANYGYAEQEVAYTGFPRLDSWHDLKVNPKQIVVMPTWRLYLAQNPETVFEKTDYYKHYQKLLSDQKLSDFLVENDLHLIFYLHNEMRKYVQVFQTICNNIEVVYHDDTYDIQELLKESALLITDYSSVHFDFAYMKKPVLYYQFDKEEFFEKQYLPGLFDVEKDGFGQIVYTVERLVEEIKKAYGSEFKMDKKYYKRMRAFYQIYDNRNCERVYEEICKL